MQTKATSSQQLNELVSQLVNKSVTKTSNMSAKKSLGKSVSQPNSNQVKSVKKSSSLYIKAANYLSKFQQIFKPLRLLKLFLLELVFYDLNHFCFRIKPARNFRRHIAEGKINNMIARRFIGIHENYETET